MQSVLAQNLLDDDAGATDPVKSPWGVVLECRPSIPGGHGISSSVVRILPWSICDIKKATSGTSKIAGLWAMENSGEKGCKRMNMVWP